MADPPITAGPGPTAEFEFYLPPASSGSIIDPAVLSFDQETHCKRGRPIGSKSKDKAITHSLQNSSNKADPPKRPVGRPPGTGPKQKALKEKMRQREEAEPAPYEAVGLVN